MNRDCDFVSLLEKIRSLPKEKQYELLTRLNDIVTGYKIAQQPDPAA